MPRNGIRPRSPLAWLWAVVYAAALLAVAPSADVRFAEDFAYLEPSLQMSRGGDWVVPRDAGGAPTLVAPVFSYWAAAVSFKIFGPSMLSARLPFILAGGLTIWLTAWLGARLADRESGRLAAMCLAASLAWMAAGFRALPDVWLTLFMTLSAGGFLLLLDGSHRRTAPWLAWPGLGLALATKGPAALLVLPALAVVWWRWRGDVIWRDLFHRPAVMAGAGLGLLWYAAVAIRLGPSALVPALTGPFQGVVAADQALEQGAAGLGFLPAALLPFTLLALGIRATDWRWLMRESGRRAAAGYALVFAGVLVLAFSLADPYPGARSMLPALPWLALLLGMLFRSAVAAGRPRRWLAALTAGLVGALVLGLVFGIAAVAVATGLMEGHESLIWRVAVLSLVAVAVLLAAHADPRRALVLPALMCLALPPVLFGVARPALPDTARDIVAAVAQTDASRPVLMADAGSLAGAVRVMAGGRIDVLRGPETARSPDLFDTRVVSGHQLSAGGFDASCEQREIARGFGPVPPHKLVAAVRAGQGEAFLDARRRTYLMITCPAPLREAGEPGAGP